MEDVKPVEKKEKKKREKKQKTPRPTGLPEGFELANKLDRSMSWFVNFGWNFGVLIAALVMMSSDTGTITTILIRRIICYDGFKRNNFTNKNWKDTWSICISCQIYQL